MQGYISVQTNSKPEPTGFVSLFVLLNNTLTGTTNIITVILNKLGMPIVRYSD